MHCIQKANATADIKSIVIQCAGRTFVAGADIREFGKPPEAPHLPDVVAEIEICDKPVLAATPARGPFTDRSGGRRSLAGPV